MIEIYDSGDIPENISRSIFIMLSQKTDLNKDKFHRTISLMSRIKPIMRILLNVARSRIRLGIEKKLCGYVQNSVT